MIIINAYDYTCYPACHSIMLTINAHYYAYYYACYSIMIIINANDYAYYYACYSIMSITNAYDYAYYYACCSIIHVYGNLLAIAWHFWQLLGNVLATTWQSRGNRAETTLRWRGGAMALAQCHGDGTTAIHGNATAMTRQRHTNDMALAWQYHGIAWQRRAITRPEPSPGRSRRWLAAEALPPRAAGGPDRGQAAGGRVEHRWGHRCRGASSGVRNPLGEGQAYRAAA